MRDEAIANSRSLSVINFVVGIWLIISPYILSYATPQARWEQGVGGLIIAIMAGIHYYLPEARWASWLSALVALWLIVAPFVSGYQSTISYWNEIIAAIIVGSAALWNAGLNTAGYYSHRGHAV